MGKSDMTFGLVWATYIPSSSYLNKNRFSKQALYLMYVSENCWNSFAVSKMTFQLKVQHGKVEDMKAGLIRGYQSTVVEITLKAWTSGTEILCQSSTCQLLYLKIKKECRSPDIKETLEGNVKLNTGYSCAPAFLSSGFQTWCKSYLSIFHTLGPE